MHEPNAKDQEEIQEQMMQFLAVTQMESVRGAVVLGVARLDYEIKVLLEKTFPPKDTKSKQDSLFSPDRALGSYESRCELAYRMLLIDDDFRKALKYYGKIRNAFAHSHEHICFHKSPYRDYLNELEKLVESNDDGNTAFKENREKDLFAKFMDPLGLMIYWILTLQRMVQPYSIGFTAPLQNQNSPQQWYSPTEQAEQDGADQPATAPESKPEDDSEPKPESEGRSQ